MPKLTIWHIALVIGALVAAVYAVDAITGNVTANPTAFLNGGRDCWKEWGEQSGLSDT